jgi:two-component system sensor histidine kinase HydH
VDPVEVARDTAALYALAEGPNVRVEGDAGAVVRARRDELKEVLINLIENARAAGARTIGLAIGSANGDCLMTVRDDGRGIAPDDLPRIFEPQFSTTTSGAGLGLAICRRLVESWGGRIAVESVLERGTTVRITLLAAGD